MNGNDPDDYKVGYGRPPQHTRFRKGQSGNPRGRPKGCKSFFSVLEAQLRQRVSVRRNGREISMALPDLMFARLFQQAVTGDLKAMALAVKLMKELAEHQAAQALAAERPRHGVLVVPSRLSPEEWLEKYGPQFPDEVDWEGDLAAEEAARKKLEGGLPDP